METFMELNQFKELFNKIVKKPEIDNGLIISEGPGGTVDTVHLTHHHETRIAANYYTYATIAGEISEELGKEMLLAIEAQQDCDTESPDFGNFKWYSEMKKVNDKNAVFFTMLPFCIFSLFYPEKIVPEHKEIIERMMERAKGAFAHELKEPAMFYPNKVMSDGAISLALAKITGDEGLYIAAKEFYYKWCDYTEKRGWGWGENTSLVYMGVMLQALRIASTVLKGEDDVLKSRIDSLEKSLIEYSTNFKGDNFVPAIRSYNFSGEANASHFIYLLSNTNGVTEEEILSNIKVILGVSSLILFEDLLKVNPNAKSAENKEEKFIVERVFDDCYAQSWIGLNGSLGSLTKYPCMQGCYPWPTWGMGWQSMPVAFTVKNETFSFLRWFVKEGENVRCHPVVDRFQSVGKQALFAEDIYPFVETFSSQKDNFLLINRSMNHIANRASIIADDWKINNYKGEVNYIKANINYCNEAAKPTASIYDEWMVLSYENASVAILPIPFLPICKIEAKKVENDLIISQVLHEGEDKILYNRRLEAMWAVVFIEGKKDLNEVQDYLTEITLEKNIYKDYEEPRGPEDYIRELSLTRNGIEEVRLITDPFVRAV